MKHRLSICLLSLDFIPNIGGVASHVYELSKALCKQKIDVTLVTANRWNDEDIYQFELDGIKVVAFKYLGGSTAMNKILKIKMVIKILLYIRSCDKQFDLFHWHGMFTVDGYVVLLLKKIFGVKNVWTNHTSYYLEDYQQGKYKKLNRLLSIPDQIIAPSMELCNKSWQKVTFNKENTHYIYNGVDNDKFRPQEKNRLLLKKLGINENDKVILCTRRLEDKCGVRYLVQAMPMILKKTSSVKLIIVGDYNGPRERSDKEFIKQYIYHNKLKENVLLLGRVDNAKLPDYYSIADISVLPSLMEAVSISGLESISSGVPLVGTKVGGIPEIIKDGVTGCLCEPQNSYDLADKINYILEDENRLAQMAEAARKYAIEKFSWDKIAKKTIKVYEDLFYESI